MGDKVEGQNSQKKKKKRKWVTSFLDGPHNIFKKKLPSVTGKLSVAVKIASWYWFSPSNSTLQLHFPSCSLDNELIWMWQLWSSFRIAVTPSIGLLLSKVVLLGVVHLQDFIVFSEEHFMAKGWPILDTLSILVVSLIIVEKQKNDRGNSRSGTSCSHFMISMSKVTKFLHQF